MSSEEELKAGDGLEPGTLYVIATPIGNLDDVTRRAVSVLERVGLIAAEDTRRTLTLLNALGLKAPRTLALHEHNEEVAAEQILELLQAGETAALVSDAGTPLVSDPGFVLVRACYEAGLPVRPVPGPSAVMAALSVCPLPASDVSFAGFLPAKEGARRSRLTTLLDAARPFVFFEAPHRLKASLKDLEALAPERRLFLAREMTKRFETYLLGSAQSIVEQMDAAEQWRGEVVCVVEGAAAASSPAEQARVMRILTAELAPAQAARLGAKLLGVRKQDLYGLGSGES
ncbi:MAG: 16S rRNA (cytidine(1402)-2'-O)-methyltransferase [Pseudomonadota bacterium]